SVAHRCIHSRAAIEPTSHACGRTTSRARETSSGATPMTNGANRLPQFDRLRSAMLIAGIAGLLVSALGLIGSREQFFRSYLLAFIFWLGIPLGSMAILMLHHLTGGGWGFAIRRIAEASTRTLWLVALLFIPLLLGMTHIYSWVNPGPNPDPV